MIERFSLTLFLLFKSNLCQTDLGDMQHKTESKWHHFLATFCPFFFFSFLCNCITLNNANEKGWNMFFFISVIFEIRTQFKSWKCKKIVSERMFKMYSVSFMRSIDPYQYLTSYACHQISVFNIISLTFIRKSWSRSLFLCFFLGAVSIFSTENPYHHHHHHNKS